MTVSEVLDQYIETALWSSTDDDSEPMDRDYSRDDIDAETLDEMENDLDKFMNWFDKQQVHLIPRNN